MSEKKCTPDENIETSARPRWTPSDPEYQVIRSLIDARHRKNITQKKLAELTGITQPDISRLENGRGNPSLRRLHTLAKGLGMELRIEFVDAPEREEELELEL